MEEYRNPICRTYIYMNKIYVSPISKSWSAGTHRHDSDFLTWPILYVSLASISSRRPGRVMIFQITDCAQRTGTDTVIAYRTVPVQSVGPTVSATYSREGTRHNSVAYSRLL
jgi:hypothetical protein